jgi:hypothetical protein
MSFQSFRDFTLNEQLAAKSAEFELLSEELTNNQKALVDIWSDKHDKKIRASRKLSDHVFGDQDRIHIPLEDKNHVSPHPDVEQHLAKHGWEVTDYKKGLAKNPTGKYPKREVRIGSILQDTNAHPDVVSTFNNDPRRAASRQSQHGLHIVISRHPHDVAGMSTGRGWASCMTMRGDPRHTEGCNSHYLENDIKEGTHVAYLTKKDDHDIKDPIARVALKPMINQDHPHDTILRPEGNVYGTTDHDAFHNTIAQWATKHFPMQKEGVYKIKKGLYADSENAKMLVDYNHHMDGSTEPPLNIRRGAAVDPTLMPHNVDKLVNDHALEVREKVAQARHDLRRDHVDKMIDDHSRVSSALASNEKIPLEPQQFDKLLEKHPNYLVSRNNLTGTEQKKVFDKLDRHAAKNDPDSKRMATDLAFHLTSSSNFAHKHFDKIHDVLEKAYDDRSDFSGHLVSHLLAHPALSPERQDKWVNKDHSDADVGLSLNPKLTDENKTKILSRKYGVLFGNPAKNVVAGQKLQPHHLELAVNHSDESVREAVVDSDNKLSEAHLDKLSKDPSPAVKGALLYSDKHDLKKKHFNNLIDSYKAATPNYDPRRQPSWSNRVEYEKHWNERNQSHIDFAIKRRDAAKE